VPDYEESPGLSGDLSHKYVLPSNARFIGPISRFKSTAAIPDKSKNKIVVLISGPEPQRSIFEKLMVGKLALIEKSILVLRGKPESEGEFIVGNNVKILPHLNSVELEKTIQNSSLVICRSGYSSVMDLHTLGAKALFIPTPGQTEQIYLAKLHNTLNNSMMKDQYDIDLPKNIEEAFRYKGFSYSKGEDLLMSAINGLGNK
jgi:UDP-N-acetylglucosamine:LPS N-acetylglucosamine transferase